MRLVVDTDCGVDDALALALLLTTPGVEVSAVGAVSGNCRAGQAAANALAVLEAVGAGPVAVAVGRDRAVPVSAHGVDGLGDHLGTARFRGRRSPVAVTAVDQLLAQSRLSAGRARLLAIGPLTNLGEALAADPLVLARFASVTVMGGMGPRDAASAVEDRFPGFLAKGDTNTRHDPVAAAAVCAARGNVTWVGMNVTGALRLPAALLDTAPGPAGRFLRDAHQGYRSGGFFAVHDSVAACAALEKRVVTGARELRAAVVDGAVWGLPVGEGAGPAHRFATAVDAGQVAARVAGALGL